MLAIMWAMCINRNNYRDQLTWTKWSGAKETFLNYGIILHWSLIFYYYFYYRDVNTVDSTMDDIRDQMDIATEISEAISRPVGEELDEVRLDKTSDIYIYIYIYGIWEKMLMIIFIIIIIITW